MRLPACRPKWSSPTSFAAASTRRRTISTSIGRSASAKSAAVTPAAASTRSGDPPSALTSSRRRPGASARTVPDMARTQTTRWHGMSIDWRQKVTDGCEPRRGHQHLEPSAAALVERVPLAHQFLPDTYLEGLDHAPERTAEERAVIERTAGVERGLVEDGFTARPMVHPGVVVLRHQRHERPADPDE